MTPEEKEKESRVIELAKDKNEKAVTQLYRKYEKTIWFTLFNIVKNSDVTDDLLSVTFTKAFQKIDSYVNHISFEMWLKTIAVNTAIDYIRKTKNEKLNNYMDDEDNPFEVWDKHEKSPEDKMILQQQMELTLEAIDRLKQLHRDLIYARLEGLSYKDIAERFDIPENVIKTQLNKARAKLRKLTNSNK